MTFLIDRSRGLRLVWIKLRARQSCRKTAMYFFFLSFFLSFLFFFFFFLSPRDRQTDRQRQKDRKTETERDAFFSFSPWTKSQIQPARKRLPLSLTIAWSHVGSCCDNMVPQLFSLYLSPSRVIPLWLTQALILETSRCVSRLDGVWRGHWMAHGNLGSEKWCFCVE